MRDSAPRFNDNNDKQHELIALESVVVVKVKQIEQSSYLVVILRMRCQSHYCHYLVNAYSVPLLSYVNPVIWVEVRKVIFLAVVNLLLVQACLGRMELDKLAEEVGV